MKHRACLPGKGVIQDLCVVTAFFVVTAWLGGIPAWQSAQAQGRGRSAPGTIEDAYLHTTWTIEDGLPQNSVNDIVQTRDGYLWLATFGGLVRFDGVTFTVFDLAHTEGLASNRLITLFEDRNGVLWIGHESGEITTYRDGTFASYTAADGLPGGTIVDIAEDLAGDLWIATWDGLLRFADGVFTAYTTGEGLPANQVYGLLVDRTGRLWAGTGNGLASYAEGRFTTYLREVGASSIGVGALFEDRDGQLWVGGAHGLAQYRDGRFTAVAREALPLSNVNNILVDRSGNFWVSGDVEGRSQTVVQTAAEGDDFPSRSLSLPIGAHVDVLFQDREDNVWIGADGGGLHRFRERPVMRYTTDDGLAHNSVFRVIGDGEGGLWLNAGCENLTHFRDGAFTAYASYGNSPRFGCLWSMLLDRSGALWVGGDEGLLRLTEDGYAHYTREDGLPGGDVVALFEDRDGVIWAGTTEGGAVRLEGEGLTVYTQRDGLVHDDVRFIMQSRDGALWFGTRQGLSRLQGGVFTSYTSADGLSPGSVRAVHEDIDGTLWIGTYGGGLSRLRDGRITRYTIRDGLFDNIISRILEDERGNLWMLGNLGLFFVNRTVLNDFAEGKRASIESVSFGSKEGMAEGNGGGQSSGWQTDDGRMWFPTIAGLAVIDARTYHINEVAPPVVIERVVIDTAEVAVRHPVTVPPGRRNVEIQYTAASFTAPEKVRFQYRLDPYDDGWQDADMRRVAFYTNIPPGRYTFHVRAANNDGVWNEAGASLSLELVPYFYETGWFYALSALFLVLVGYGAYQARTRSIRAHNNRLHAEIVERRRVEESLRASEEKFARAFRASPDAIVLTTLEEGRIVEVNDGFHERTGYRREEVIGRTTQEVHVFADPEERTRMMGLLQQQGSVRDYPIRLRIRSGEVRDCLISVEQLEIGGTPHLVSIMRDVTDQKRAEAERERLIDELEGKNAELEQFTYTVSHDLKTPLVTIKGFLGLLEKDIAQGNAERIRTDFVHIANAADKMGRLLGELLELSRIGRVMNPPQAVSLTDLARDAVALVEGQIQARGVQVALEPSMPAVSADRSRLLVVYQNLLDNAVKFMGDQRAPRIEVGAYREGAEIVCYVRDNGVGIDPAYHERVFGLFDRLDAKAEGTGIGLALVKRIVEVHGGRIWVASDGKGCGAAFCFTLPPAAPEERGD